MDLSRHAREVYPNLSVSGTPAGDWTPPPHGHPVILVSPQDRPTLLSLDNTARFHTYPGQCQGGSLCLNPRMAPIARRLSARPARLLASPNGHPGSQLVLSPGAPFNLGCDEPDS